VQQAFQLADGPDGAAGEEAANNVAMWSVEIGWESFLGLQGMQSCLPARLPKVDLVDSRLS